MLAYDFGHRGFRQPRLLASRSRTGESAIRCRAQKQIAISGTESRKGTRQPQAAMAAGPTIAPVSPATAVATVSPSVASAGLSAPKNPRRAVGAHSAM